MRTSATARLLFPIQSPRPNSAATNTTTLPILSPRRRYFDTASSSPHNKEAAAMDGQDTGALPKPKPKPKRFIPVPPEYRRLTHATERELIVNDIKINTGCDVIPKWDAGYITQFAIAGQGAGVEKAVRYINHWISNAHIKSKYSSSWAKTPAFDHNKWYYDSIEERERQRKDEFKGKAPEVSKGEMPLASIIVCWPEDLLNEGVTPRDVFNNKLEALNAIRTQNEVYITLLPTQNDVWQIEIQGKPIIYLLHAIHTNFYSPRHSAHRSGRSASHDDDRQSQS